MFAFKSCFTLTLCLLFGLPLAGCDLVEPVRGCTDALALNRDFSADEDDGSCTYSRVVFYAAELGAAPVVVNVDGQNVGTLTAFYPNGPGNCSAPGTITMQLRNGAPHDWDATDGIFITTGIVQAKSAQECLAVRVF